MLEKWRGVVEGGQAVAAAERVKMVGDCDAGEGAGVVAGGIFRGYEAAGVVVKQGAGTAAINDLAGLARAVVGAKLNGRRAVIVVQRS